VPDQKEAVLTWRLSMLSSHTIVFLEDAPMPLGLRLLTVLSILPLFCGGCSALIAYTGEDVAKLANKGQVHESFGAPTNSGAGDGCEFEEYHTRRKISEPTVCAVCLILGLESGGIFELWNFPAAICRSTWSTLVGQDLRFVYTGNGEVKQILINGTPMDCRASLP
jgi:hypothetical protein